MFANLRSQRKRLSNNKRTNRTGLTYDGLEAKNLLTTFIVTTVADSSSGTVDGFLSLREAVIAANTNSAFGDAAAGESSGDVIRFSSSISGQTIALTLGQISISDDVLIQGGASGITISGNGNTRLFEVTSPERVGISKLTLTSGSAGIGGAIASFGSGTTLLYRMTLSNNVATGIGGGAAYNANGNLFLIESTLVGNRATGATGAGGAVYSASGFVYANASTFTANTANQSGGAVELVAGDFFTINAEIGTAASGNTAGPLGSANPGNGGGLHISGTGKATIVGGGFTNNYAASNGGGVWVGSAGSLFMRNNASVSSNEAAGSGVEKGGGGVFLDGGAIYANGADINNNSASGTLSSGGGILSDGGKVILNNTQVDSNASASSGGGIYISDAFMSATNSDITQNDVGTTFASATGLGGGIYAQGTARVVLSDGQVGNNTSLMQGGGIWADTSTLLFMNSGASVSFNSLSGSSSIGGGIYTKGYLQALDSFFQRNTAGSLGGGLYLTPSARARIDGGTVYQNDAGTQGGGVYNNGFMYVSDSSFLENVAGSNGGGYFTTGTATTLAIGITFSGNTPNNFN